MWLLGLVRARVQDGVFSAAV